MDSVVFQYILDVLSRGLTTVAILYLKLERSSGFGLFCVYVLFCWVLFVRETVISNRGFPLHFSSRLVSSSCSAQCRYRAIKFSSRPVGLKLFSLGWIPGIQMYFCMSDYRRYNKIKLLRAAWFTRCKGL